MGCYCNTVKLIMKKLLYIAIVFGAVAALFYGYIYVRDFSGAKRKIPVIPAQKEREEVLSTKFNYGSGENDFGLELSPLSDGIGGNRGPSAITQDAAGNIYLSDLVNSRIKVLHPDFKLKLVYKTDKPLERIIADARGNIYGYGGGPGPVLFLYKYSPDGRMLGSAKIFDNVSASDPAEYRYRFGALILHKNKIYTVDPVSLRSYLIGETGDNFIAYPIAESKSSDGIYGASGRIYYSDGTALQPGGFLEKREFLGEDKDGDVRVLSYTESPGGKILRYLIYKYNVAGIGSEQLWIDEKDSILSASSANFSVDQSGDIVGFFIEKDGLTIRRWSAR